VILIELWVKVLH